MKNICRNLESDLPELGHLLEDIMRENGVEIGNKAPSSVGLLSSKGSVHSGGSAISRSSKVSRH